MKADSSTWARPPGQLLVPRGEVHVWRAQLDVGAGTLERLWFTLSEPERTRAELVHPPDARRRTIAARGVLRDILSRYLHLPPSGLALTSGPNGKPELATSAGRAGLWFNHSRSAGLGLYCVSRTGPVGVDLEYVRPDFDWEPVAALLALREREAIRSLPPTQRRAAFFRCWTRKEACLKATGQGLGAPLDSFEVPVEAEPRSRAGKWWIRACEPATGYAGAVASEVRSLEPACWNWTG
jgi:4'-phosphopantetheinyl transferase